MRGSVCMHVCMYVCMHARVYAWMYVCKYSNSNGNGSANGNGNDNGHGNVNGNGHVMHVCIYLIYIYISVYVYVYVFLYVYVYVCVYIYMYIYTLRPTNEGPCNFLETAVGPWQEAWWEALSLPPLPWVPVLFSQPGLCLMAATNWGITVWVVSLRKSQVPFKGPFKGGYRAIYSRLQKMKHGCRMIHAGVPSFFSVGLEDVSCSNVLASTGFFLGPLEGPHSGSGGVSSKGPLV